MEWLRVRNMVFAKRQGFSLVEGMLAVAVFGLVTSAIATAVAYGQQSASLAGQRERAALLADKTLEAVRSIAFDDWKNVEDATASTNYGLALSGGKWTLSGTSSTQDSYTQTVSFTDLCRDTTTHALTVCTGSNRDPQSRRVTATITWTGLYNFERSVSITTDMTNWGSTVWEQSDWVGGANQSVWSDITKYDSDTDSLDVTTTPGQVTLDIESGVTGKGCGVKTYDFDTPANYTTSSADITIASGTASLTNLGTAIDSNTKGLWHVNDVSSPLVDATGNNNSLTQNGNSFVYSAAGKFGTSVGSGDGLNDYWQITDALQTGLESMSALTIDLWYKTGSSVNAGSDTLVAKYGGSTATNAYRVQWNNGVNGSANVGFSLGNGTNDVTLTSSQFAISANTAYHIAVVYDGSQMVIYVNGSSIGSRIMSGTVLNTTAAFRVGGGPISEGMPVGARIDEVRVSNSVRYTSNFSAPTQPYGPYFSENKPTVQPSASYDPVATSRWQSFTETATKSGAGEIYYQLSDDAGITWKWWNGSAWATVSAATDYNTASTINTNITSFPPTNTQLLWKAFLVSNGSDSVSLDNITVTCVQTNDWDFSTAGDYTAGAGITISSGSAALTASGTDSDANTIALWHLNELTAGATVQDYSTNNNDLTASGSSGATWGNVGKFGTSILFPSVASVIYSISGASQTGLSPTGSFTLEGWINKTSRSTIDDIILKWGTSNANRSYGAFMGSSGLITFQTGNGTTTTQLQSATALRNGTWEHVAFVFERLSSLTGQMRIYVNGVLDASVSTAYGAVASNSQQLIISNAGSNATQGALDEWRFSNTVRYSTNFTVPTDPHGKTYSTTTPSVSVNSAFTATSPSAWHGFTATQSTFNESNIFYQLSNDGVTWKWWNGSSWANVVTATDYNSATIINTNIPTFPTTGNTLYFKTFLYSTGSDLASIDNIEVMYVQDAETDVTIGGGGGSGTSTITSSAFDMGANTNITNVEWDEPATPCDGITCVVKLELRTAPDSGGAPGTWTDWYGATTAGSFFTDRTGTLVPSALQGNRWVQYRATLDNTGGGSPQLDEVRIFYD